MSPENSHLGDICGDGSIGVGGWGDGRADRVADRWPRVDGSGAWGWCATAGDTERGVSLVEVVGGSGSNHGDARIDYGDSRIDYLGRSKMCIGTPDLVELVRHCSSERASTDKEAEDGGELHDCT